MFRLITLSLFSAVLFFISWPPITQFTFLIFIAFVPLFILESYLLSKKISIKQYYIFVYTAFFFFNLFTTFWVKNAHLGGAIFAIFCNSFFMANVFFVYIKLKSFLKWRNTFFILPVFWIGFEYLHLNWDLSWPWLTLGNIFSAQPAWVQWYSWTGALGGTLWVFIVNMLFFRLYNAIPQKRLQSFSLVIFSIIIPLIISHFLFKKATSLTSHESIDVLVVQPNINPYTEKFTLSQSSQMDMLLNLISPHINQNLDFIIMPETFLSSPLWQHKFDTYSSINNFKSLNKTFPNLNIIVGAVTFSLSEKGPRSKPMSSQPNQWYKVYNSALHITENSIDVYNKAKLVPGAEQMPFQNFLYPILGDQILTIGSSTALGNFAIQDTAAVFSSSNSIKIAPAICYESIYGDYMRKFIQKGAQVIFIITNDGWWKKTSGYQQHSMYAQLRAIETRRYIARSANTGVSSIINQLGEIQKSIPWDKEGVISYEVPLYNLKTFYVRHGDFLGRLASFFSILILLCSFVIKKLEIKI